MRWLGSYNLDDLRAQLQSSGQSPTLATRITRAFYAGFGEADTEDTQLSRTLRATLREMPPRPTRIREQIASDDGTLRLLLELSRGGLTEAVLMPSHRAGEAACCVSSQVGCAMGCDFCASTLGGLTRNLGADEIVDAFLHLSREAHARGRRIRRLVFMGMGEPMHNLDAVEDAIHRIAHPALGGLGWKRITVSTVGIVPGIQRLARLQPAVHLALSLHAADDATRQALVPVGQRYTVERIVDAARRYQEHTRRPVNIELCLLAHVNDTPAHARRLAEVMGDWRAHVNVIPYNPIGAGRSGRVYERPAPRRVQAFLDVLHERGVVAHARVTRGDDVDAACGQLAARVTAAPQIR